MERDTLHGEDDPSGYRRCGPFEPDRVEVCFSGRLLGEAVQWHAVIATLQRLWREQGEDSRRGRLRPFLEVQARGGGRARIEIGLGVEHIDAPTILKTVIMVRQYKRLRPGRHEFGEAVEVHR